MLKKAFLCISCTAMLCLSGLALAAAAPAAPAPQAHSQLSSVFLMVNGGLANAISNTHVSAPKDRPWMESWMEHPGTHDIGDAGFYGLGVGYHVNSQFSVSANVSHYVGFSYRTRVAPEQSVPPYLQGRTLKINDIDSTLVLLNLWYSPKMLQTRYVIPFVKAGAGVAWNKLDTLSASIVNAQNKLNDEFVYGNTNSLKQLSSVS